MANLYRPYSTTYKYDGYDLYGSVVISSGTRTPAFIAAPARADRHAQVKALRKLLAALEAQP